MLVKFAPFGGEKSRAGRHSIVVALLCATSVANERATPSLGFHFLQVARNGFLRDVSVQPPPKGANARFRRRTGETGLQIGAITRSRNQGNHSQEQAGFFNGTATTHSNNRIGK